MGKGFGLRVDEGIPFRELPLEIGHRRISAADRPLRRQCCKQFT
jgi:hypothetical protein